MGREAAAYWVARSSRAVTGLSDARDCPPSRRPGERRDPYAVYSRFGTRGVAFRNHEGRWLWVPAFAGTTCGDALRVRKASSPSLPWRDDLDLVAVFQCRLRPFALRHHVVIQRNGKMVALIFELAQERVDAGRQNLPQFAIDGHAHCITSLSIWPRST